MSVLRQSVFVLFNLVRSMMLSINLLGGILLSFLLYNVRKAVLVRRLSRHATYYS